MRKYLLFGAGLIIISVLSISCGVPQEAYDKAADELATLNATYAQVSGDLQVKSNELELLNIKYDDAVENLDKANIKLDKLKLEIAIYNAIFLPALTGELDYIGEEAQQRIIVDVEADLEALGDAALTRKYNQMKFSGNADATAEFFIYLLQDMEKTLKE